MSKEIKEEKFNEKIKNKSKFGRIFIENILCFFIIICPILDISSFIFRDIFKTNISISTFVRPIIPILVIAIIFFKYKFKKELVFTCITYGLYAFFHLYIYHYIKTESAYGGDVRELQYLVNYTFMIMNLFIFLFIFRSKLSLEKLRKSVLISLGIYIFLMYLALITKTSSYTYIEEQLGYKGWFESGNSIGTIMLLSLFIVLPMTSKEYSKLVRISSLVITILVGAYLTTLLGTRTGLFGFILVIGLYLVSSITIILIKSKKIKINKKTIAIGIVSIAIIGVSIFTLGSKTLERRRQLRDKESEIYDLSLAETSHVTGDMLTYVKQINNGEISEEFMSKEMQQTILDVYKIANDKNVKNTDMRKLQLLYHLNLVKNQKNIFLILFGNGYMANYYEMVFEMEVPAFLLNFGLYGFVLYFIPFLSITLYGIYISLKKIKEISVEYVMYVFGAVFAIVISFLSGYTFFNSSSMMIIIVLNILIFNNLNNKEIKN